MSKMFRLIGPQGQEYLSPTKGQLGGNSAAKIYGQLDCPQALRALKNDGPYSKNRVFFPDETAAISAGYRPCGACMREQYRAWRASGSGND